MLTALLALAGLLPAAPAPLPDPLALVVAATSQEDEGPSEELVETTVTALEAALKEKDPARLVTACNEAAEVPHEDVAKVLAKTLKVRLKGEPRETVLQAALAALGAQGNEVALKALHRTYAKDKDLRKHEELGTALLRAIGSHAHESSIEVLTDDVTSTPSNDALRARALGLARIRTDESLAAVIELMNRMTRGKRVRQMEDFRLALCVLTGVDKGKEPTAWMQWWNDVKKSFEVQPKLPTLPKQLDRRWRQYWGIQSGEGRGSKREDRGGDGRELLAPPPTTR